MNEQGQATVEWTGLVLLLALAFGAVLAVVPHVDGRSYGGFLAHAIFCALQGGCDDGDAGLQATYGAADARLLRRYAPNIVYEPGTFAMPVDFRRCRSHRCADAPDDPDLDAHRSARGEPATVFTHLRREGGHTYLQYWLYYPDSNTAGAGRAPWDAVQRAIGSERPWPGFHRDDWESYQVRLDARGQASVRASSHRGYQGCKHSYCTNRWTPLTGWTRVSTGSHAGHIPLEAQRPPATGPGSGLLSRRGPGDPARVAQRPLYPGVDFHERTSTAAGLRLVPLDGLDTSGYERLAPGISPPWEKEVWAHPDSDSTA